MHPGEIEAETVKGVDPSEARAFHSLCNVRTVGKPLGKIKPRWSWAHPSYPMRGWVSDRAGRPTSLVGIPSRQGLEGKLPIQLTPSEALGTPQWYARTPRRLANSPATKQRVPYNPERRLRRTLRRLDMHQAARPCKGSLAEEYLNATRSGLSTYAAPCNHYHWRKLIPSWHQRHSHVADYVVGAYSCGEQD